MHFNELQKVRLLLRSVQYLAAFLLLYEPSLKEKRLRNVLETYYRTLSTFITFAILDNGMSSEEKESRFLEKLKNHPLHALPPSKLGWTLFEKRDNNATTTKLIRILMAS
jgi:hypothetical protein